MTRALGVAGARVAPPADRLAEWIRGWIHSAHVGYRPGMSRAGEKVFGIAAIVVGLGIVVAAAAGMTVSPILLAVIGLVVVGWLMFYWTVVRQRGM